MATTRNPKGKIFCSLNGTLINLNELELGISSEVIKEKIGNELIINKRPGPIIYDDFIFETAPIDEIINIISKTWKGENLRLSGSFITTDHNQKAKYEDLFLDSLLTETTVPECDPTSKTAALFGLRIKPALVRNQKGDERTISTKIQKQKSILKSNFRFELGKLPCSRITKIDSFSVNVNVSSETQGNNKYIDMASTSIEFPNIYLTISSADLQPWLEWQKEFIIDGKNSKSDELSGRLVFLGPNLKDELLTIHLNGVGIFSLQRKFESGDKLETFRVGLYCESMELENIKETKPIK